MPIHSLSLLGCCFTISMLIGLSSCAPMHRVAEIKAQTDSTLKSYYLPEQFAVGDFFTRRTFHLDMMAETMQPDAQPYPQLGAHFGLLKNYADSLTLLRIELKQKCDEVQQKTQDKKRVSEKSDAWKTFQQVLEVDETNRESRLQFLSNYKLESGKYDSLTTQYKVIRMTNPQLVEFIGLKMVQFQDSMEVQGRLLAQSKSLLNSQGWERRSEEYKSRYRTVSEMELKLKHYAGLVGQLENSLNRFEAGNMEEYFYKGPYMPERPAISATEDAVGKLILEMQAFREMEQNFRFSFDQP